MKQPSEVKHPLEAWRLKQRDDDGRPLRLYQLADRLECAPSRLTQIIHDGETPSMGLANRIKQVTGISMERLFVAAEKIKRVREAERCA